MSKPDLWSPTRSPQTMPDGPGESEEAYRAKLAPDVKGPWIYYDPDFRREVWPRPEYPTCETCQRKVDPAKAVRVETYNDFPVGASEMAKHLAAGGQTSDMPPYEMTCRESSTGKHYIGRDCWKRIVNQFGFEPKA